MQFNPLDHPIVFSKPQRVVAASAWIEHLPFGILATALAQPDDPILCRRPTGGIRYSTFCQTVAALSLPTKCYAVDALGKSDDHAGHYGSEVLADLALSHHDPPASCILFHADSGNLRSGALPQFSDGSIDLLHIDGRHGYEDAEEGGSEKLSPQNERSRDCADSRDTPG